MEDLGDIEGETLLCGGGGEGFGAHLARWEKGVHYGLWNPGELSRSHEKLRRYITVRMYSFLGGAPPPSSGRRADSKRRETHGPSGKAVSLLSGEL